MRLEFILGWFLLCSVLGYSQKNKESSFYNVEDTATEQSVFKLKTFSKKNVSEPALNKIDEKAPTLILNEKGKYIFQSAMNGNGENRVEYDDASSFINNLARVSISNKWGFIDTTLKNITPIIYEYVWSFDNGVAIVQKNRKYGLINTQGKEITPIEYDYIDFFKDGFAIFRKKWQTGYLNVEGKEYSQIEKLPDGWFKVKKNEEWGYANQLGIQAIPYTYDDVRPFYDDFALVNKKGKWEYINKKGDKMPYDEIFPFISGFALVRIKENYVYINRFGNEYDSILRTKNNRVITIKEGKYGMVNFNTQEIIPPKYDYINEFNSAITYFKKDNQYGFIDTNGREVIPAQYDQVYNFKCNRARVKKNQKYGYIKMNGNSSGEIFYSDAEDFSENLAVVKLNNKYGFIDTNNTLKLFPIYLEAQGIVNGFAKVKKQDNKWAYINSSGVEMPYDEIFSLSDSMILVRKLNKYGYIDLQGKVIIPGIYDSATDFKNGLAMVMDIHKGKNRIQYIRKNGEALPYDNVFPFQKGGIAKVEKNEKYGLINQKGQEIITPIYSMIYDFEAFDIAFAIFKNKQGFVTKSGLFYDEVGEFKNKIAIVKKNKKYGLISSEGYELVKPVNEAMFFTDDFNFIIQQNEGQYKMYNNKGELLPYETTLLFSEGLAVVVKNQKYGYINTHSEELIPIEFDWAGNFRDGKALVKKGTSLFYINRFGQIIR